MVGTSYCIIWKVLGQGQGDPTGQRLGRLLEGMIRIPDWDPNSVWVYKCMGQTLFVNGEPRTLFVNSELDSVSIPLRAL